MSISRRGIIVIIGSLAAVFLLLAYGSNRERQASADPPGAAQSHVEQAASSIIAAAKESVAAADSDQEAIRRTQLSVDALRIVGLLGEVDMDNQTAKLLDDLQSGARPEVVAAIVQMRLGRQLRKWDQMDDAARKTAIHRFVADVKETGLSREHADLFLRLSDMLESSQESELASSAIKELLPEFQASNDKGIQRRAPLLEGMLRRLPGSKLELEGTLLDGSALDWESYRGKVVLVDFFASWCGPCREEVPNVIANYRAFQDKGFEVVGVNMDKDRRAAEAYVNQSGFHFPTLFSDDQSATGWDHPMARKYGITALPRVILVDKDGVIVHTEARGKMLRALLQELLGSPGVPDGDSIGAAETDAAIEAASFEEEAAPQIESEQ